VGSDSIEYDKIGNPTIWGQKNEDGIWFNGALLEWQGRELQKYHPFTEYDNGSGEMYYPVYFKYNDEGIRTYKEQDGIDHEYILDGSKIVGEWIYNRTILILYIYDETGSPIGMKMRTSSQAEGVFDEYFFEKNLQGDIVAIYNASGAKIGTYTYDAWGNFTVTASGSDTEKAIVNTYNPFRYRGYYYDVETGLYYLQSRYYNPAWGRFINADAISYLGANGDLQGYNLFAYCSNNPVSYEDPQGTFLGTIIGAIGGAIVGGISAAVKGDNILAGISIGAATGAIAGLAVDIAVATGGLGGIAIAAVGGALSSSLNYCATETVNGREIDPNQLIQEATLGAAFNVLSFGVAGGSTVKATGSLIKNMVANAQSTVLANTTRSIAGGVVFKSTKDVVKNITKNLLVEFGLYGATAGGQILFSEELTALR